MEWKLALTVIIAKRCVLNVLAFMHSLEHRVFIEDKASGNVLSPFHDIPLWANEQKVSIVISVGWPVGARGIAPSVQRIERNTSYTTGRRHRDNMNHVL